MNIDKLRAIVDAAPRELWWDHGDKNYLATFNPAVVRAMLDVCEAAKEHADYAWGVFDALAALDEALKP